MKIVLDSHYAPSIAWWALAARAEEVCIEQHSFFRKGTYRNRCHIYGANGLLRLSIPLKKGKGQRSTMKDVQISYDHDWRKLHWESLCSAYRSSPYFEFYEMEFNELYQQEILSLHAFNLKVINEVKKLLGLDKEWSLTSAYQENYNQEWIDGREIIHPNAEKHILKESIFLPEYLQVFGDKHGWLADLSILDLLFNVGPASLDYLTEQIKIELPF
ncbi:MAG: WbqC family protein [Chitinophagales bacterium]